MLMEFCLIFFLYFVRQYTLEQLDMGKEFDKMIEQTLLYLNGE